MELNNFYAYVKHPNKDKCITLDANMVGYLYVLSSPTLTTEEYVRIRKVLTNEQFIILSHVIENDFKGVKFCTTSQVINEIIDYARVKKDNDVVNFLARICKIHIPKTREDKVKCAELIAELMEDYLRRDIPLSNGARMWESAIASEVKNGEEDFSDARIIAENTLLNGCPVITRNEKHLVSMSNFKRRNDLRSQAIREKNKIFFQKHRYDLSSKNIRQNLHNEESTTYRIGDLPWLTR